MTTAQIMATARTRREWMRMGLAAGAALLVPLPGLADMGRAETARLQADPAERLDGDLLRLRWRETGRPAAVSLLSSPDQAIGGHVLAQGIRDGEYETHAPDMPRPYFRIRSGQASVITAERLLPLQGGRNFRDLGGYGAADGRMVQWGRLYRSGTMTFLTPADYDYLSALNIRAICDLRTTHEREVEPNRWKEAKPIAYWSRDYNDSMGAVADMLRNGSATADGVRAWLKGYYRTMPYDHAASYREMFRRLSAGEIPLAFNCSAGKDRTGLGSALILTALDVPHETVLADYNLTEKYQVHAARDIADAKGPYAFLAKLPPDVLAALMRADPDYLQASFDAIQSRNGSVDAYLANELGVSASDRARLRAALLV